MKPTPWGWTVQEQIEKNKQLKLSDIKDIQTWIREEKYLPNIADEQVLLFLHACNYNVAQTKETIEKCYIMRTKVKDFFAERDLSHPYIQRAVEVAMYAPLAGFDKDGNQVIWMKLTDTDPSKYYYGAQIKLVCMLMDAVQLENGPVPGYVFVLDAKGYTLSHMLRTSLGLAKKFIAYAQEASTFFPKTIYVLNASSILDKALAFVKPFMKSDLFSVIKFLKPGKHEVLLNQIPIELIPNEYGGKGGSTLEIQSNYMKKMAMYADWFKEEEKLRIDDKKIQDGKGKHLSKTLESTKDSEEDLSLRNLAID